MLTNIVWFVSTKMNFEGLFNNISITDNWLMINEKNFNQLYSISKHKKCLNPFNNSIEWVLALIFLFCYSWFYLNHYYYHVNLMSQFEKKSIISSRYTRGLTSYIFKRFLTLHLIYEEQLIQCMKYFELPFKIEGIGEYYTYQCETIKAMLLWTASWGSKIHC